MRIVNTFTFNNCKPLDVIISEGAVYVIASYKNLFQLVEINLETRGGYDGYVSRKYESLSKLVTQELDPEEDYLVPHRQTSLKYSTQSIETVPITSILEQEGNHHTILMHPGDVLVKGTISGTNLHYMIAYACENEFAHEINPSIRKHNTFFLIGLDNLYISKNYSSIGNLIKEECSQWSPLGGILTYVPNEKVTLYY